MTPDLSDYVVVRIPGVTHDYEATSKQSLRAKGLLLYMSLLRMHIQSYLASIIDLLRRINNIHGLPWKFSYQPFQNIQLVFNRSSPDLGN